MHAVANVKLGRTSGGVPPARRWALLALQIPATPSNARVKTWRRLQQLGAVPVKNAVYVLPASTQAVEDFSWLGREVEAMGGQATVFQADAVEAASDGDMVELFRRARAADYKQLLADVRTLTRRSSRPRRADGRDLRGLRERFEQIRAIDFFAAPGGADVERQLTALERQADTQRAPASDGASAPLLDRRAFARRRWVTRPRPGVDRFACAWLIRRFIDPNARFAFAIDTTSLGGAVPFDMFDVGFRHEGDRCTFEVLAWRFGLGDPAVRRLAEIVHDIDLKDDRYRTSQAPTVSLLVDGLRSSFTDDHELLQQGMHLFEALYRALSTPQGAAGRQSAGSRRRTPRP